MTKNCAQRDIDLVRPSSVELATDQEAAGSSRCSGGCPGDRNDGSRILQVVVDHDVNR
jgi:hypothetical protein